MLDKLRNYLLMISFIVIAGGLMLYVYVLAKGEGGMFGGQQGTLEPVSFEALTHAPGNGGYLLCDQSMCTEAEADRNAEIFNVDGARVRAAIADYADNMPTIRLHNYDFRKNQFDYLERLPGDTYPAVISIRVLDGDRYSSKLAIFSNKPVGNNVSEENAERVARWLAELHRRTDGQG